MYDPNNGTLDLYWDANGNLAQVIGCKQNSGRLHEWDVKRNSRTEKSPVDSSRSKCGARVCQSKHRTQLDRLRFVLGGKYAGYYGYNANGERVYKLTGTSVMDQVNSGSTKAQAIFDEATVKYDKEKAKNGDPVEREKCNNNEQNSIGKENIVRTKLGCKNRPNDYFTNDDY
jgi:hypothetical protein